MSGARATMPILSDTRYDMTHPPARHPFPTPCTAGKQSDSLAAVVAGSSEDVTNNLACAETEHHNVSSDASRHERQEKGGFNQEYHHDTGAM